MTILLVLMAVVTPVTPVGEIWIHTEPGVIVSLDGVEAGISTAEEAGLRLKDVAAGRHLLTMQIPGASATTMTVEVKARRTTDVNVSSIALRASPRLRVSTVEIRVAKGATGCVAAVGEKQKPIAGGVVKFEDVPGGTHELVVACGSESVTREVNIPAGRSVVAEVDFAARELRVLSDRPRVTQLVVEENAGDTISSSPLSGNAKQAMMTVLARSRGVRFIGMTLLSQRAIDARFEARDAEAAADFVVRLSNTPVIQEFEPGPLRVEEDRVVFDVTIVFVKER